MLLIMLFFISMDAHLVLELIASIVGLSKLFVLYLLRYDDFTFLTPKSKCSIISIM